MNFLFLLKNLDKLIEMYRLRAKYFYAAEIEQFDFDNIKEVISYSIIKEFRSIEESEIATFFVFSHYLFSYS